MKGLFSYLVITSIIVYVSAFYFAQHNSRPYFRNRIAVDSASREEDIEPGYFTLTDQSNGDSFAYTGDGISFDLNGQFADSEVQRLVVKQMVYAFDNLPVFEVQSMFKRLWKGAINNGPYQYSCIKLIELSKIASEIEDEYVRRQDKGQEYEDLTDNIRVLRSQIRMYGKDAEFYDDDGNYNIPKFTWPWMRK